MYMCFEKSFRQCFCTPTVELDHNIKILDHYSCSTQQGHACTAHVASECHLAHGKQHSHVQMHTKDTHALVHSSTDASKANHCDWLNQ